MIKAKRLIARSMAILFLIIFAFLFVLKQVESKNITINEINKYNITMEYQHIPEIEDNLKNIFEYNKIPVKHIELVKFSRLQLVYSNAAISSITIDFSFDRNYTEFAYSDGRI